MSVAEIWPREDFARPQRHDIQEEQATLGSMMLSADSLAECLELLTARAFYRPAHQIVFESVSALASLGLPVDALTVRAHLEERGEIGKMGGSPYLHTLLAAVPTVANGPWYARRLLDYQAERDLDTAGTRIRQIAAQSAATRQERIVQAYEALDDACGYNTTTGAVPVSELIVPLMVSLERGPETVPGIGTGWTDLDSLIRGLRPGQVIVVAARPALGKSSVLLNMAANAAMREGRTVLAVTLEMSRDEYTERLLAAEAQVSLQAIRGRSLERDDWDRIARAHGDLSRCDRLTIHEGPELSVQDIRSELRAMRRAGRPADLVTIDYIQLVAGSGRQRENRQAEVSEISRGLKLLAKEAQVPVVVAAQLNRGPEMRSDHKPLLADIRETGALENDADIVILLYREDAYEQESPRAGEADFIVAKHRNGPTTTVTVAFQGHYSRFVDMARSPWSPSAMATS